MYNGFDAAVATKIAGMSRSTPPKGLVIVPKCSNVPSAGTRSGSGCKWNAATTRGALLLLLLPPPSPDRRRSSATTTTSTATGWSVTTRRQGSSHHVPRHLVNHHPAPPHHDRQDGAHREAAQDRSTRHGHARPSRGGHDGARLLPSRRRRAHATSSTAVKRRRLPPEVNTLSRGAL